jgi:hypothetical protein
MMNGNTNRTFPTRQRLKSRLSAQKSWCQESPGLDGGIFSGRGVAVKGKNGAGDESRKQNPSIAPAEGRSAMMRDSGGIQALFN